jgi:hypothetical protein
VKGKYDVQASLFTCIRLFGSAFVFRSYSSANSDARSGAEFSGGPLEDD